MAITSGSSARGAGTNPSLHFFSQLCFYEVIRVGPLNVLSVFCLFVSFLNFPHTADETGILL